MGAPTRPRLLTGIVPPLDAAVLDEARRLVREAASASDRIADELERACHELACIEDSGQSGTFRRLIAVAIIAFRLKDLNDREVEDAWPQVVAFHRAVDERWNGATYDLSNCLASLQFLLVTKLPLDWSLGTWVWLNLEAGDRSALFRWTMSTRRFEPSLGREIVARSRATLEGSMPGSGTHEISPEEAERIARDYGSAHPKLGVSGGVLGVVRWQDLVVRRPNVYGKDDGFWETQWVVYLEQPQPPGGNSFPIRSSIIVAVDRFTGEVGYAGSARDEG